MFCLNVCIDFLAMKYDYSVKMMAKESVAAKSYEALKAHLDKRHCRK